MKLNFSFNSNAFNFWEIYNVIKKFYPIGLTRCEIEGNYFEYEGIKELIKIINENISNQINFEERWGIVTKKIGKKIGKEIVGTTYGFVPGFSSSILLERNFHGNCIYWKELHFSVSLIGNFYQIYGSDKTRIVEQDQKIGYSAINAITVSPYKEFESLFNQIEFELKEVYSTYKIVPFSIGQSIIDGLQVTYVDDIDCSINMALFNNFLSEVQIIENIRGDINYGIENWKIS